MCRWGCPTVDTTYQCKWCGTRYCRACLRGEFTGIMLEATRCRMCNQTKCQGDRVEYVEPSKRAPSPDKKGRGKSARSTKSAKSAKSRRSAKSGKKSGKKRKK